MANEQLDDLETPSLQYCCAVAFVMLSLLLCGFLTPPLPGPLEPLNSFYLFVLQSRRNVQILFLVLGSVHVGEAMYAWYVARSIGSRHVLGWTVQTLLLGFGSLGVLKVGSDRTALDQLLHPFRNKSTKNLQDGSERVREKDTQAALSLPKERNCGYGGSRTRRLANRFEAHKKFAPVTVSATARLNLALPSCVGTRKISNGNKIASSMIRRSNYAYTASIMTRSSNGIAMGSMISY